jgi:hypothetical protein
MRYPSFAFLSLVALGLAACGRSLSVLLQADSLGLPRRVIEEMALDHTGPTPAVYAATSAIEPVLSDSLYWITLAPHRKVVAPGGRTNK